jgi:hypothetical protein
MYRTFRQRIAVLGLLVLFFLSAYGIARHYSAAIVTYVVKQALLQKAPEGMDRDLVQERFDTTIDSTAPEAKLMRLMVLSNYLEKVQKLTPAELDRLLAPGGTAPGTSF